MNSIGSLAISLLAGPTVVLWAAADPPKPSLFAKPEHFETLVDPDCSYCRVEAKRRAVELRDDEPILAWTRGPHDGGGIPLRFFLVKHRVISDTYGVFVYDPDAGFVRGFEPSLDFRFHGWRNGILVLRHQKDGSLYSALSGLAFDGPNQGQRLKPIPTLATDWGYWHRAFPDTVAYTMIDRFQPAAIPTAAGVLSAGTRPRVVDQRLPEDTAVFGVHAGGVACAYPISMLRTAGLVNHKIGGESVVLLWYEPTRTAACYRPVLDGPEARSVTLTRDDRVATAPFVDETGSRWSIAGRAVSGPLQGKTLRWVDSVQCRWFAWAAEYPETQLRGRE
jgi:hypothetical protein